MTSTKKSIDDLRNNPGRTLRSASELAKLEQSLIQFKTELLIKREHVTQLTDELDKANKENAILKDTLDKFKKVEEEDKFNLMLMRQMRAKYENDLQEKRETFAKMQIQHKLATAELEAVKEMLQVLSAEKTELTKKVENYELKQRYDTAFTNDTIKKYSEVKNLAADLQKTIINLQDELSHLHKFDEKLEECEYVIKKCAAFAEENKKNREEKLHFEAEFVKLKAKHELLLKELNQNPEVFEKNILLQTIIKQWQANTIYHKNESSILNKTIETLSDGFSKEKQSNLKLIAMNESLTLEILELKKRLNQLTIENEK